MRPQIYKSFITKISVKSSSILGCLDWLIVAPGLAGGYISFMGKITNKSTPVLGLEKLKDIDQMVYFPLF
jgi:hypothetical protein